MGKIDWDVITNYTDAVTTTLKTVTFPKVQEQVYLRNQGNANFTYTIGSQSGTLTPGQSVTANQDVSSFTLQAASGTHTFEVRAKEKGTEIEEAPSDVPSQIANLTTQLADIAYSPFNFGAKGDGVTDDTQAIANWINYCVTNKKAMYLPPYIFAITNIVITLPSNNGFFMFGRGKQSGFKIINTNNQIGLQITATGNFRVVVIKDINLEGTSQCGSGIKVIRAVRPSEISGITGTNFTNIGASPIEVQDCIDATVGPFYTRTNFRGLTVTGQCDALHIEKPTVYDFSDTSAIKIVTANETTTGLLENSVGININEPYIYASGTLGTDSTGKIGIDGEDTEKMTLYGGWFENVEYALYGRYGAVARGMYESAIYNPRRGGSIIPKIYLENADYAVIHSLSCPVSVDARTVGATIISPTLATITEGVVGANNIITSDKAQLIGQTDIIGKANFKGGVSPFVGGGMYAFMQTIADDAVYSFTPETNLGIITIMGTTSSYFAIVQFRAASSPIATLMLGSSGTTVSTNVLTGATGTDGNLTIGVTSDGKITIENRTGSSKTFRASIL